MALDPLSGMPEFSFFKDRSIVPETNPVPAVKAAKGETVPKPLVETLFSQMDGVIYKADTLLSEIKRVARPFVPVHPEALEVRLAIRAMYPGASEDMITFDQYTASIEFLHRSANIDIVKVNSNLSGDDKIDSRIIYQQTSSSGLNKTPEEMAIIAGQFGLLAICNRMLQTFQAPNTQQAVAGKFPPATEIGATLAQVAIGLAAVLMQTAISRKEAAKILEESFSESLSEMGTTADGALDQASQQEPDELLINYRDSQAATHQENIRTYAYNYASSTTVTGYEPWAAADDVHAMRTEIQYSKNEGEKYLTGPYQMSHEIYKLLACKNVGANDRLNMIAGVLSNKYTKDLICCFVRIVGNIPTSQLKQVRWLLHIFANGISLDFAAASNAMINNLNSFLEQAVLEPILHAVDNYFRDTSKLVMDLIDPSQYSDPKVFETLLVCTPFDEMLTYVTSALGKLQALIVKQIRKYWNKIQLKNKYGGAKIRIMGDNKRARMLLTIVDQVIAAVDKGNLCAVEDEHTPSPEDVNETVEEIEKGMPPSISVEVDGEDPYRSFSSKAMAEAQTQEGIPFIRKSETRDGQSDSGLRDCARAKIDGVVTEEFKRRAEAVAKEMKDVNLE